MHSKKDDFAKGQEILHLFGRSEDELINNLKEGEDMLLKHFIDLDRQRHYRALYNTSPVKGIQKHMFHKGALWLGNWAGKWSVYLAAQL